MTESDWKTVVTHVRSGSCVLLLGSDALADQANGAVTPRAGLIAHLSNLIQQETGAPPTAKSLGGLAHEYRELVGRVTLETEVQAFYKNRKAAPSLAQKTMAGMPFPLVITSAHDEDFKTALGEKGKQPDVAFYHFRSTNNVPPEIPPSIVQPALYYMHGSIEDPKSLVLSDSELIESLIELLSGRAPFPTALTGYLRAPETCFLFIGFGLRHWYLRLLLHALTINRENRAVALETLNDVPETHRQDLVLFYRQGHKIVFDDTDPFAFVTSLSQKVEAAGGVAALPPVPVARARVFISYASEDRVDAERLDSRLSSEGLQTWLDKHRLEGGDWWDQKIRDAIDDYDYVVVLQTAALLRKIDGYVNDEIKYAVKRGLRIQSPYKCVIPFSPSKVEPYPDLKDLQIEFKEGTFDEQVKSLASIITRDYQLRARGRKR